MCEPGVEVKGAASVDASGGGDGEWVVELEGSAEDVDITLAGGRCPVEDKGVTGGDLDGAGSAVV
ncbi:MAG: hypothetical protein ACYTGQ_16265, partial [Planctomycetota bacterium]